MGAAPAPPQPPQSTAEHLLTLWQHPELLLARLVLAGLIVLLAGLVYAILRRVLHRLKRRLKQRAESAPETLRRRLTRSLTVLGLLNSVVKWALVLLAGMWVLTIAGVNLWPLLTGAGIAGLAIGLGAQSLIRDFISGFFILLEGQFAVGDQVTINGVFGVVQEVGLRVTVLRDLSDQVHYLPNGGITTVTVHEAPRLGYVLDLELPAGARGKEAAAVLKGLLSDAQEQFAPYLPTIAEPEVRSLSGGVASIRAAFEILPRQEWLATEELPVRLMRRLKAAGFELADDLKPRVYAAPGGS